MITTHEQNIERLRNSLSIIAAYQGSDLYRHFLTMLECVEECYRDEMMVISQENLQFKQGAAAQVRSIRKALTDATPLENCHSLPKV